MGLLTRAVREPVREVHVGRTGDMESDWAPVLAEALAGIEAGGSVALTTGAPVPRALLGAWRDRLVSLLEAGASMHDRRAGQVVLRRDATRVLYLAPWVTVGGADRATIDWLRTLSRTRFRRYLVTTQESDNLLLAEAERHADEVWCLPDFMPGDRMPEFIARFVADRQIDVVHVMNSKLGFDLLPALRATYPYLRTVVQLHAEELNRTGYPSYVATRFDDHVDAYSLVSRQLRERMTEYGVASAKAHVIYLGVDTSRFDPMAASPAFHERPSSGLQILFPHRLVDQKDPLLMVAIAAALKDAGSDSVIHVVGDGELRAAVEGAVAAAGLGSRVVLHGAQADMAPWYQATDVTLLTSRFEGVPLAVYESMAMGRPVVTPDVGAVSEVVDSQSGIVLPCRDSVADYVAALRRLEDDPEVRVALGDGGRRQVDAGLTVESMAAAHERLYTALAADYLAQAWQ